MTTCIKPKDYNTTFGYLLEQYNLNKEADLDSAEKKYLDNVSKKLSKIFKKNKMEFNEDGFKSLVVRLYPKNATFGGSHEKITVYTNTKTDNENEEEKFRVNQFDFYAIIGLLVAVFFCWIAFVKMNELSVSTSGLTIENISSQLVKDIQAAVEDVKRIPGDEMSFLKFIFTSVSTFSCSVVNKKIQHIQAFVATAITESIKNAGQIVLESAHSHCGLSTKVLSEDWGIVGSLVNTISSASTGLMTQSSTSQCILNISAAELQKLADAQSYALKIVGAKITTQGAQISDLLSVSAKLGAASIGYLTYRASTLVKKLRKSKTQKLQKIQYTKEISNSSSSSNGGRRTYRKRNANSEQEP